MKSIWGHDKTLALIVNAYFLPNMRKDINHDVETCCFCHVSKGSVADAELYMPLLILTQHWVDISMNFVFVITLHSKGHRFTIFRY